MIDNNKIKILISGDFAFYSRNNDFLKAFKKLNISFDIFDDQKKYNDFLPFKKQTLIKRIFHRLTWKYFSIKVNNKFLNKIKNNNYDVIFIIKGWFYHPRLLKKIKEILPKAKLICYNPDNPFNTWHHGVSNNWIRASIPLFDIYFTPKKFLINQIKKNGCKNVIYLPCGYDPDIHYPIEIKDIKEKEIYGSDIAFIGTYDEEREWWLNQIKDYNLKIWGNDWWKANKDLQKKWMKKPAYGEEFNKICSCSKIILNIIRKQDATSHNMKTFEIPACKGFVLSNYSEEAVDFFPENIGAVYFKDEKELKEKIDFYISNEFERKKIIEEGYNILKNNNYTYFDRIKDILLKYIF